MKIKMMFIFFLCVSAQVFSQNTVSYSEAVYSVSFPPRNVAAEKDQVQSLLVSNIKYVVNANDSLYSLEATEAGAKDGEHLHTNVSGPQKIYFDVNRNIIVLDTKDDQLHRYNTVRFTKTGKDTVVNDYACKLLLSPNGDSLFVTEKLPWFVNPFLLNKESAHAAVVKAIMKNGSVYDLLSVEQKKGIPFQKTVFPVTSNIKIEKNIFF